MRKFTSFKKRFHGGREIRTHDQRPMVLPSTPCVRWQGGDTEYPLAGLPILLVLTITRSDLRRRRREAALLFPESWWHLTMWGSRPSHFMIIPNTKHHPNNTKTDQLPISEIITGLPRPYHNTIPANANPHVPNTLLTGWKNVRRLMWYLGSWMSSMSSDLTYPVIQTFSPDTNMFDMRPFILFAIHLRPSLAKLNIYKPTQNQPYSVPHLRS